MIRNIYITYLLGSLTAVIWISWQHSSLLFFGGSLISLCIWAIITTIVVMFHSIIINVVIEKKSGLQIEQYDVVWIRNFIIVFLTGINISIITFKLGLPTPYSLPFISIFKFIFSCFFLSGMYGIFKKLGSPSEKFFLGIKQAEEDN